MDKYAACEKAEELTQPVDFGSLDEEINNCVKYFWGTNTDTPYEIASSEMTAMGVFILVSKENDAAYSEKPHFFIELRTEASSIKSTVILSKALAAKQLAEAIESIADAAAEMGLFKKRR